MYECQNCEKEFEEPIIIDNEPRCPNCMSGDVIDYKNYTLEEIMDAFEECAKQREALEQENKQLKEDKKKAREYIKFEWQEIIGNENYSNHLWTIDGLVIKRLLEILGDEK